MANIKSLLANKDLQKKLVLPISLLIIVGVTGYFAYDYYNANKELSEYKQLSNVKAIKEKNDIVNKVGKFVLLPEGEEPTLATVTDAFKLREQKFFTRAENGDKVLIFAKAGRAILYRPSINRVIEAAPVNISDIANSNNVADATIKETTTSVLGDNTSNTQISDIKDPEEPAKVAIYNGTQTVPGLANKVSSIITKQFGTEKLKISELANTYKFFDETIVVNISKKYNNLSKELTKILTAKEADAPESETKPDADILIIIGRDFNAKSE